MIHKLSLRNFQSHSETDLEFHPGINSIIGSSDNGKSATLRALQWAINNRPSGSAFVSYWAKDEKGKQIKDTEVIVEKGGKSLTRFRTSSLNGYAVDNTQLEAIGTDVPEQVKDFFGMSEVNIQKQLDAPFLISESAGAIARFFNSIIKLDSIDKALSSIDRKKRDNKINLTNAETKAENIETALKRFDWIPEAEELVDKAEKYNNSIEKHRKDLENVENNLVSVENQQKNVENAEKTLKIVPLGTRLENLQFKKEDLYLKRDGVVCDLDSYQIHQNKIRESAALVQIADEGLIEKAQSLEQKIEEWQNEAMKLGSSMVNYIDVEQKITKQKSIIKQAEEEMPDVCPACGRPMEGL